MTEHRGRTGDIAWAETGESGGRPPLLLLHPLGADRQIWSTSLDYLSPGHRVLLIDLPGHGLSSAQSGEYTVADLGSDIVDVAAAAGAGRFDLCGVSLGGLISLWIAANHPDLVNTLVVSNTAARVGTEELWQARIEAVGTGGMEAIREMAVARFFTGSFIASHPVVVETAERTLLQTDPSGYVGCCAALRDADLREDIGSIRCPTLVIGGDQDASTPPDQAVWLHEHIAGSSLRVLEGAAHFSNLEQPDAWGEAVAAFYGTG